MAVIRNPMCTTNGEINIVSGTGPINISTEAAENTLTLGNDTMGSSVVINTGTTGLIGTSTGPILLDAAGAIELNSSAAAIEIGNDAVEQAINIGTGAAARVISVGNSTGATSVSIYSGSGDISMSSTASIDVDAATSIGIGSDAASISIDIGSGTGEKTINVGGGTGDRTISIGNGSGASVLTLETGTGSLNIPSFTTTGALVSDASGLITDASGATSGHVLTAGGVGVAPSFQASPDSGGVTAGTENELAYYAVTGNDVSGLPTANSSVLVTSGAGVPAMTASMTDGQIVVGSTGATPVPTAITAGGGISVTNGAGSITIGAIGGGITWSEATVSATMDVNNGYIANNGALVTLTLPTTSVLGDVISVQGYGAGSWSIAQGASQSIRVGSAVSTIGVGGSVSAANQYDSISLVCVVANTEWLSTGMISSGLDII